MTYFLTSRMLNAIATLVAAVIATFIMIRIAPGDPVLFLLGDLATQDQIAAARADFGLDRPILEQLFLYLVRALTLNFGNSIIQGRPAIDIVFDHLSATLLLGAVTFALVMLLAIPIGLMSGFYRNRLFDRLSSNGSLVALGVPDFWLGLVLILIFSRWLNILPSAGWSSWASLIMPSVTLALPLLAVNIRLIRNEAINILNSNMVKVLRAKGMPERRIATHHVFRNALLPVLTVGGVQFGHLLGGAVIVETVFGWPGLGNQLITAIGYRDYSVVQACIFVMTLAVVSVNLAVDIGYRLIDPRLRG